MFDLFRLATKNFEFGFNIEVQAFTSNRSVCYSYNFSYNTTSIGTIANRNSAMANMEHSTLPANSNSAAYLFHLSDPNASSASNPNLTRGSLVSSTSSANQVSENQGATTGKRLGDVAEDSTDSLAPTRRNNRALVDSLFNDFTPLSPRME